MSETSGSKTIRTTLVLAAPLQTATSIASSLRMKQCEKIAELREALVEGSLDAKHAGLLLFLRIRPAAVDLQ